MFQQQRDWETRENASVAFSMGPLIDFWRQWEEAEFTGVDDIPVHFVRLRAEKDDRIIVVCPGCIESYMKYVELAYDLFHSGFDVLIINHRGQGRSGRMPSNPHHGHVDNFSDYADDLTAFWQQEVLPGPRRKRYILTHSMGGAIVTSSLQYHPNQCGAIALCAPMFGTMMRFPDWMVRHILDWAEEHPRIREGYVMGTGCWRVLSFGTNALTHSRQCYRRNPRFYADESRLRVGGLIYHWVREGTLAGEQILAGVGDDVTPTLLIQAEEEYVVDNRMYNRFCELHAVAGHPVEGGQPLVIKGAYHEILFEKDAIRSAVLNAIVEFFNKHNSSGGTRFAQRLSFLMHQVVASDLDDTLLSPDHTLSPHAKETLKLLTARGVNFVLAIGRCHVDVGQIRDDLGIKTYMITSNGAHVHNSDGNPAFSHNLDRDIASDLFDVVSVNPDIVTNVRRDDEWSMNRHRPDEMRSLKEVVSNYLPFEPVLLGPEGVSKVFFTTDSHGGLPPLEQAINTRWGDRVNVSFSTLTCLEVVAGGVSKGHTLEAVAKAMDYNLRDCIAFGDGTNDAEMFSMAGRGRIMGNTHQRLKDLYPELEVAGPNADDAMPYYLRELLLQ